ncbi:MAG: mechanosensitive ion channel [Myxococcales bacterium]|nr:mechanosensitive ion channel family protein [Polyangiaceae bacterium]MDW8248427.1 mechanosensitive ion channel [Myxococcales bacterium]
MIPRIFWSALALVFLTSTRLQAQTSASSVSARISRSPAPSGLEATALPATSSTENWVKKLVPSSLQEISIGGMMLWQWLGLGVGLILGWIIATLIASAVVSGLDRLAQRTITTWNDLLLKTARRPVRLLLWVVFFQLVCSQLGLPKFAEAAADHMAYTGYVIGITWLLLGFLHTGTTFYEGALADDTLGELKSRTLRTRLTVARSISSVLFLVISSAVLLMQFEVVRNLGLSLLASAGVGVAVLGFAAQKSLAGIFAGIQLSISQPVRIGDLIQYENELGNIEEINLTYVVIKLWDERRLVVPISKFVEANVLNWSRGHLELLGTVFIHADPTLPVPLLRAELERLCAAHKLWDKRKATLAVTDMSPDSITLRALVSVSHPDHFFDLRNDIREGLIAYLRELDGGAYLPRRRWAPAPPPVGTSSLQPPPPSQATGGFSQQVATGD